MSDFIKEIAILVRKHAPTYNIRVHSPIIAQAILESAKGTSELAVKANNFFGLKYRAGRCPTVSGIYHKIGSEQNNDGSYVSSEMQWCLFSSMEDGVIGYFDFINNSRYWNLRGITDPRTYLEIIKSDGYATSLKYVDNLMNVIREYNLTKYDEEMEDASVSNSSLVSYTKISPNKTSPRNHKIDTITIHCVVGQLSVESICGCFTDTSRQASCNYAIGSDGRIGLCVDEKDRSWCSSNSSNDHRAITIECASEKTHPYEINDDVYNSLIKLCVDICKRNDIKELKWKADKSLIGQVDKQNMTVHRWFANKACPGDYIYNRLGEIAKEVNNRLGSNNKEQEVIEIKNENQFKVRVDIDNLNIRTGPGTNYDTTGKKTGKGVFTIVSTETGRGSNAGWGKLKSGAGWISLDYAKRV